MVKFATALLFSFTTFASAYTIGEINCPILECDPAEQQMVPGICYQHDGQVPTKKIQGKACGMEPKDYWWEIQTYCPFSYLDNEYAWINETLQAQEERHQGPFSYTSQISKKKETAYCKPAEGYLQNLLPGRHCYTNNNSCRDLSCFLGVCTGKNLNKNCNVHADCGVGMFCGAAADWPYATTCLELKQNGDACNLDVECQMDSFCWYQSAPDVGSDNRKCLSMYEGVEGTLFGWKSLKDQMGDQWTPIEDFQRNGKFCKSGLAFNVADNQAMCGQTKEISQESRTLDQPFKCDPTDPQILCKLQFDVPGIYQAYTSAAPDRDNLMTPCKCAMTDQSTGFCGSVIGTHFYEKYTQATKAVYKQSNCHTLDRDNMHAQKDLCGAGKDSDEWKLAVETAFNVTHWPYIHSSKNYKCVKEFFKDSLFNMSIEGATGLSVSITLSALAVAGLVAH